MTEKLIDKRPNQKKRTVNQRLEVRKRYQLQGHHYLHNSKDTEANNDDVDNDNDNVEIVEQPS